METIRRRSVDAYETVCSFLNRFGGELFLGVLDDGTVEGVPESAAQDMKRNFIKRVSNPNSFSPTIYLEPKFSHIKGKPSFMSIYRKARKCTASKGKSMIGTENLM